MLIFGISFYRRILQTVEQRPKERIRNRIHETIFQRKDNRICCRMNPPPSIQRIRFRPHATAGNNHNRNTQQKFYSFHTHKYIQLYHNGQHASSIHTGLYAMCHPLYPYYAHVNFEVRVPPDKFAAVEHKKYV